MSKVLTTKSKPAVNKSADVKTKRAKRVMPPAVSSMDSGTISLLMYNGKYSSLSLKSQILSRVSDQSKSWFVVTSFNKWLTVIPDASSWDETIIPGCSVFCHEDYDRAVRSLASASKYDDYAVIIISADHFDAISLLTLSH